MASVEPFRWRDGRICKAEKRTGRPPHGDNCTCKVLVWRTRWRTPEGASRSENFDRKRDADARANEVEAAKLNRTYVDRSRSRERFVDYANTWADAQDWKPYTREQWPNRRGRVVNALGGDHIRLGVIEQLTLLTARGWLAERYARSTVAGDMRLLKAILTSATANGRIAQDPGVDVDAAPKQRGDNVIGRVRPKDIPSRAETFAILQGAPEGFRAAVALGLAGLRIGETLGMRKDRLQLDTRSITVDIQRSQAKGETLTTTKNERTRTIVVPSLVALELRRHLRENRGGVWTDDDGVTHHMLFLDGNQQPMRHGTFYRDAWWPALAAAGLKRRYKYHALRHFTASNLLAAGASLPAVAGYIGDSQETVVKVYSHWLEEDAAVPADILDQVLAEDEQNVSPTCHDDEAADG